MPQTIQQLLATLAIDGVTAESVSAAENCVVILRDPEPDQTGVAADGTIYLRAVNLAGAPDAPDTFDLWVWVDRGSGEELAYNDLAIQSGFDGASSAYGESTALSPYCFREVTLDPTTPFTSEQEITVHVRMIVGVGGFGHFPFGHLPFGHATASVNTVDKYYTFTVADTVQPNITAVEGIAPMVARVTFDDAMATSGAGSVLDITKWVPSSAVDPVGVTRLNEDPVPGANLTISAVAAVAGSGDTQFDLTFNWEQTPDCLYQLQVRSTATDSSGNLIDTATAQWSGYTPPAVDGRQLDHWRLMPLKNRLEDASHDLKRVTGCFNEIIGWLLYDIDRFLDQFDPDLATDEQIEWMLYDMGNPFDWTDLTLTANQKRKLLRSLINIYKLKGTDAGIEQVIHFLLGEVVDVVDYIQDGWVLGIDELGQGEVAEVRCDVTETYDFSGGSKTLTLTIDGAAETVTFETSDFTNAAAGIAAEVVAVLNAQLSGGAAYVDGIGDPASVTGTNTETFALSGAETLEITINGVAKEAIFHADDFTAPGAATAAEINVRLAADLPELTLSTDSGAVVLTTKHRGADAQIQVTGGTAQAILGLDSSLHEGTDDAAVTIYSLTPGPDAAIEVTGGTANAILQFTSAAEGGTGGAILAPSDSYTRFSFDIETQTTLDASTQAIIRRIADYMKPAHTHLVRIREPLGVLFPQGWALGIDELDTTSELSD